VSSPFQPGFESTEPTPTTNTRGLPAASGDLARAAPMALANGGAAAAASLPAPGWFQEPGAPGVLRYWNGVSWEDWRKPLVEAPSIDQGQKSIGVAYLLLIFVGATGAHRFYLGRTGSAVAMLVLWLVGLVTSLIVIGIFLLVAVSIWQLVDLFLIPGIIRAASLRSIRPQY
jgi:TM2 domain-containing membrane protein YozV